jgi:hypothetical protein
MNLQSQVPLPMRSLISALLLTFISVPAAAEKWDRPFIDEPEAPTPSSVIEKDREWKESATSLPPWPQDSDLVEFPVDDPSSPFRQYIDGRHLTVGADGAVRYTLVVESRSGSRNVSFEGLRCTPSGAFKVYAYGNRGRFHKTESEWTTIHGRHHDKIHRDLHKQILCIPREFRPRPKKDMIRAMGARVSHEANTGFQSD